MILPAALRHGNGPKQKTLGHPPAVDDEAPLLGVELAAQPAGVRIQRPGAPQRAIAPDVAEQLLLGEDPGRVGCQRPQQRELLVGELDPAIADLDPPPGGVDQDLADPAGSMATVAAPPQDRDDPRSQLRIVDRLANASVVRRPVRADLNPA